MRYFVKGLLKIQVQNIHWTVEDCRRNTNIYIKTIISTCRRRRQSCHSNYPHLCACVTVMCPNRLKLRSPNLIGKSITIPRPPMNTRSKGQGHRFIKCITLRRDSRASPRVAVVSSQRYALYKPVSLTFWPIVCLHQRSSGWRHLSAQALVCTIATFNMYIGGNTATMQKANLLVLDATM